VEVVVESFKEEENIINIRVTLYVERDHQKGIILGRQGAAIQTVRE
jgi:GTP-binding protein Era